MQEDRSRDWICSIANYTFVNERLAKHYGIPNIYGSEFRRVTLRPGIRHAPRAAGQGHVSDGLVAARPDFAGAPRQDGHADVPRRRAAGLRRRTCRRSKRPRATYTAAPKPTMRQQMEMHRKVEPCASCHKIMDPIGFALENFDAIGHVADAG